MEDACEQEIDIIIENMLQIQERHKEQEKKLAHNLQLPIFRISQLHFVRNVLIFLDEMDLVHLAGACKSLKKLVFSPISLQILMNFRTQQIPKQEELLSVENDG